MVVCTDDNCEICPRTDFMTSGWFKDHYQKENVIVNEDLRKRLSKVQRLLFRTMKDKIEITAQLMLTQYEILRLEFGVDLEKEAPELYECLKSKADGSWLKKGVR